MAGAIRESVYKYRYAEEKYVRMDVYNSDIRRLELLINNNSDKIVDVRVELRVTRSELNDTRKELTDTRKELNDKIDGVRNELTEKISSVETSVKVLDQKLEGYFDTLTVAMNQTNTRIDDLGTRIEDLRQDIKHDQNRLIMLVSLIVTVITALIQYFLK